MNVTERGLPSGLPMVSVVVPTRNRPDDLARALPSVLSVDYPDYEVIVVDQSTDGQTRRVVEETVGTAGAAWRLVTATDGGNAGATGEGRRLIYRRTDAVGVSLSLNEGVRLAQGDVMAFTPDDAIVPADWLARAAEVLAGDPDAGMVFGAVAADEFDWQRMYVPTFVPKEFQRLHGRLARLSFRGVMGANMVIRRAVFQRVGGFDECLGTGCRFHSFEDADLAYRALRGGFAVVLDPLNSVTHWGGRDFSDGSAQRLIRNTRYGKGAFLAKHIRCGDVLAVYAFFRGAFGEANHTLTNLLRNRSLTGAGRFLYLLRGFLAGLRQPLDRKRLLFLTAPRQAR